MQGELLLSLTVLVAAKEMLDFLVSWCWAMWQLIRRTWPWQWSFQRLVLAGCYNHNEILRRWCICTWLCRLGVTTMCSSDWWGCWRQRIQVCFSLTFWSPDSHEAHWVSLGWSLPLRQPMCTVWSHLKERWDMNGLHPMVALPCWKNASFQLRWKTQFLPITPFPPKFHLKSCFWRIRDPPEQYGICCRGLCWIGEVGKNLDCTIGSPIC